MIAIADELGKEILSALGMSADNVSEFTITFKPQQAVEINLTRYVSGGEGVGLVAIFEKYQMQKRADGK